MTDNYYVTSPQQVMSEETANPTSENQPFEERLEHGLTDDNMHRALERFAPSWRASRATVFASEEGDYGSDYSFAHMRSALREAKDYAIDGTICGSAAHYLQVSIFVPNGDCQNNTFSFMGSVNIANVNWGCTPPAQVYASLGNCVYTAGQSWICSATVSSDANNQSTLTWSTNQLCGFNFNQSSGTLVPGQPTSVTATVLASDCSGGTFNFADSVGNIYPAVWTCETPTPSPTPTDTPTATSTATTTLVVTPTSFVSTSCTQNGDGSWTCSATLSLDASASGSTGWKATSSFLDVSFSPNSGALSPGGQSPVAITIPASDCSNGTFTFTTDGGSTASASWSCSTPTVTPTDTPTPTPLNTPIVTPTPGPTDTPTAIPTNTPTSQIPNSMPMNIPTRMQT